MGKSQARRLREATKRFGRENWGRWYNARAILSILVHQRKKDAGLIAPTMIGPVSTGPALVIILMTEQDSNEDSVDNSVSVTRHKIIFVGDAGVGKTTIIGRIMDNPFNEVYEPSIGVDFMSKNIKFRGQNVKLQMWDTAGQEKYKGLIPSYVRNSSIVFVVYDISLKSSFDNIPKWINFIKTIENTTLVLCGNKIDISDRQVSKEEGEALAQKEGISFFEVSAKTDENIKNMFYNVVSELSTFSENNPNKENLIKELMQENGVENVQGGIQPNGPPQEPQKIINVNGETKTVEPTNQRKKKRLRLLDTYKDN